MSLFFKKQIKAIWSEAEKKNKEELLKLSLPHNIIEVTKAYVKDNDVHHLLAYSYPKTNNGNLPVVIYVHGGGWYIGNIEMERPFSMTLASHQFGVITMNYHPLPHSNLKTMIQDIYAALHFAYKDRLNLPYDFNRVCLIGDSAGGMLIGVVQGCENNEAIRKAFGVEKLPFTISALCFNHPVGYLKDGILISGHPIINHFVRKEYQRELFGRFGELGKIYKYAANFDSILDRMESFPPSLVITSTGDVHYRTEALRAYEDLKKHHFNVKIYDNKEKPDRHVFNVAYINDKASIKANNFIAQFFNDNLAEEI